jgi:hypothetical protein
MSTAGKPGMVHVDERILDLICGVDWQTYRTLSTQQGGGNTEEHASAQAAEEKSADEMKARVEAADKCLANAMPGWKAMEMRVCDEDRYTRGHFGNGHVAGGCRGSFLMRREETKKPIDVAALF